MVTDRRTLVRAIVLEGFGGPETLVVREAPDPEPGHHEILVRVRVSGVNRADLSQRRGHYPAPPGEPADIPGLEFAGTVERCGRDVSLWSPGDPVMGIVGGGGYAERLVIHERAAVRVPRGMTLEDAGAVPEVFMTAWDALVRQMALGGGETVLIHAVGSGVGTAAVQLARDAGARTLGTSRTPEKLERARELGLHEGLAGDGWPERVRELTGGRGADLILDLVGGPYLAGNLVALAPRGRHIVVGVPGGARAEIDLRALMGRRGSITGTVLRARPLEEKMALAREFEVRVVPRFEAGALRPVVDRVFAAEEAPRAHAWMEENRNFGKILLLWDQLA